MGRGVRGELGRKGVRGLCEVEKRGGGGLMGRRIENNFVTVRIWL